jgi:hypothetical protein
VVEENNMNLPLNADVFCTDGRVGHSTTIILNPVTEVVTHLVVKLTKAPHTEYLVPVRLVGETTPASIHLHCTGQQLKTEQPYIETEFISVEIPHYASARGWPVALPEKMMKEVHHHHIPLNEMAIHRGAQVKASDGRVGQVDEFLVNADGHVTHLILRQGHLFGKKEIAVPIAEVAEFDNQRVELKLNKKQIESLPVIAIRR